MPPAPPQAKPVPSQNSSDDIRRPFGNETSITRCVRPPICGTRTQRLAPEDHFHRRGRIPLDRCLLWVMAGRYTLGGRGMLEGA